MCPGPSRGTPHLLGPLQGEVGQEKEVHEHLGACEQQPVGSGGLGEREGPLRPHSRLAKGGGLGYRALHLFPLSASLPWVLRRSEQLRPISIVLPSPLNSTEKGDISRIHFFSFSPLLGYGLAIVWSSDCSKYLGVFYFGSKVPGSSPMTNILTSDLGSKVQGFLCVDNYPGCSI